MRAHALALVLALPALAACSGGEATPTGTLSAQDTDAQWQDAADKALGAEADLEALKRQAAADCQRTDAANWVVFLGTAGDTTTSELTRIGLEHLCPEVEETFVAARKKVEAASDVNALVCSQPVAKLDTDARMKLDFMC